MQIVIINVVAIEFGEDEAPGSVSTPVRPRPSLKQALEELADRLTAETRCGRNLVHSNEGGL